jgi:hypothetical protein
MTIRQVGKAAQKAIHDIAGVKAWFRTLGFPTLWYVLARDPVETFAQVMTRHPGKASEFIQNIVPHLYPAHRLHSGPGGIGFDLDRMQYVALRHPERSQDWLRVIPAVERSLANLRTTLAQEEASVVQSARQDFASAGSQMNSDARVHPRSVGIEPQFPWGSRFTAATPVGTRPVSSIPTK